MSVLSRAVHLLKPSLSRAQAAKGAPLARVPAHSRHVTQYRVTEQQNNFPWVTQSLYGMSESRLGSMKLARLATWLCSQTRKSASSPTWRT